MKLIWCLCLTKDRATRKIRVRVLSEKYVPKKGERTQIIGRFLYKANAKKVQKRAGDKQLKGEWGTTLFLTDETMYSYIVGDDGRAI